MDTNKLNVRREVGCDHCHTKTCESEKKQNSILYIYAMLLQLENTDKENVNKLLAFARQNHLQLSLVDDCDDNIFLPGKPLTPQQLNQLIETSRKSGTVSMTKAHRVIRTNCNAD